ncbi:DUF2749 domain-containing protein [Brucella intermedia]|uniref:Uncharacterized protein n=1 Tax=Brucella intermedia M86 TaxID=1234597 RepID=M5JJU2_9HYPH|nr:DUF2749 domain-containing protein [Brucella intermedia]ELT46635.1 hypothetical protein D584_23668 [Brucella intermedia M86]
MPSISLPLVVVIAFASAAIGGGITYAVVPKDDSEARALLARQVELLEAEAAEREAAAERRQDFFSTDPDAFPTTGGQEMAPRFGSD